jgi:hypothetical protein
MEGRRAKSFCKKGIKERKEGRKMWNRTSPIEFQYVSPPVRYNVGPVFRRFRKTAKRNY